MISFCFMFSGTLEAKCSGLMKYQFANLFDFMSWSSLLMMNQYLCSLESKTKSRTMLLHPYSVCVDDWGCTFVICNSHDGAYSCKSLIFHIDRSIIVWRWCCSCTFIMIIYLCHTCFHTFDLIVSSWVAPSHIYNLIFGFVARRWPTRGAIHTRVHIYIYTTAWHGRHS